jgi:DNA-binding NarL/FixJ family response regulator
MDPQLEIEHCPSIAAGLQLLAGHPFELVLLDHDLGGERASQFLPAARQAGFDGRVLVVTAWVSETEARRLLQQGVAGIFLKHAPLEELTASIRTVMAGGSWVDRSLAVPEESPDTRESTSPLFNDRQRKVLRFVLEGLSNKEIAWRLQISESYVKAILQSLFQKTGVRTRGQLVRVAFEQYEDQL